jgi:hypothetical protein
MAYTTHLLHHVIGRLFALLLYLVPFVTLVMFIPISEVTGGM